MSYQIGDRVFTRDGRPALVVGRNENTESLVLEEHGEKFEKTRKYGYINGLSPEERKDYKTVIDEARKHESADMRVQVLQQRIEAMRADPSRQVLRRYLESEMTHIINSEGVKLDRYEIEQHKIF